MVEDIRQLAPKGWVGEFDEAMAGQLPTRGHVRSPNGLVHEIIGDFTYCDIQWAAFSKKQGKSLRVIGWEPCDDKVSCLECLVEI